MKKLYIVQKYIWANSIPDAIKKDSALKPDEVYLDANWRNEDKGTSVGFSMKKSRSK